MKAGIIGATGYGGLELIRLLSVHPEVKTIRIFSTTEAGTPVDEIYSHLNKIAQTELEEIHTETMKHSLDVIFLAAPAGVSVQLTPQLLGGKAKVIDLSGDLRLKDPAAYQEWYKKDSAPLETINQAVYGLSEWNGEAISKAETIANPGCYPTAALLGSGPVVKENLVIPGSLIIDAKSGVSGAGKNPAKMTHFAHAQENLQIYKVNQHQHIPEIEQQMNNWDRDMGAVTFSTHLVPMTRGIMATTYLQLNKNKTTHDLLELYENYYGECPFVRVRKEGQFPCTKDVHTSNYCDIGLTVDERTNRVTIVSVIDNLMKGAASQAVQNMNLLFSLEESTGIQTLPVYP
ncbi:N-acetyl-gamma-glutamyl-phosphate reductase [Halobacillus rhizosphaerae]|uniref:N-acetyl-gamma-glutamyl-phosphate reductase n=1 Tax=Halobacillus rhizosphaerae TaxID=3064889 RepID=UPI00398ADB0D